MVAWEFEETVFNNSDLNQPAAVFSSHYIIKSKQNISNYGLIIDNRLGIKTSKVTWFSLFC